MLYATHLHEGRDVQETLDRLADLLDALGVGRRPIPHRDHVLAVTVCAVYDAMLHV